MHYRMTSPCDQCPFLQSMSHGFSLRQLKLFASGEFACHKACDVVENEETGVDEFTARGDETPHCAGALIFLEKRDAPHQMMRICERLGMYDRAKLNMEAAVR